MNVLLRLLLLPLLCLAAHAGEPVEYKSGDLTLKGYVAIPDSASATKKVPGILVVHEWWGHNDYARQRADKLAHLGYAAVAVDMYGDGKTADHPKKASEFATAVMTDLDEGKARFLAALELLHSQEGVDTNKTAAIGYCFGGGVVLHMARTGMDLDGVVSFHGALKTNSPAEAGIGGAKILVCHGADDTFVKEEDVEAFQKEMGNGGFYLDFRSYGGAKHGFTNPEADVLGKKFKIPLAYNEAADTASWRAMSDFFKELFAE